MRPALLLLALLALPACDAVGDAVDSTACGLSGYADEGEVRAVVDGSAFSGTCVRVETDGAFVTVIGVDNVVSQSGQEAITLTFPIDETGTFELPAANAAGTYAARTTDPREIGDEAYVATSGTLTVTALSDDAAEGTFAFTARNAGSATVTVASGRFDVSF